jgi:hypothetical protein
MNKEEEKELKTKILQHAGVKEIFEREEKRIIKVKTLELLKAISIFIKSVTSAFISLLWLNVVIFIYNAQNKYNTNLPDWLNITIMSGLIMFEIFYNLNKLEVKENE